MWENTSETGVILAMPGAVPLDCELLRSVAEDFGWAVRAANGRSAGAPEPCGKIVGVIFHRSAVASGDSWPKAIESIRAAYPDARLIGCQGFSEPSDWVELSGSELFHVLQLPLKESEVRQSLGFVWAAEKKTAEAEKKLRNSLSSMVAA